MVPVATIKKKKSRGYNESEVKSLESQHSEIKNSILIQYMNVWYGASIIYLTILVQFFKNVHLGNKGPNEN